MSECCTVLIQNSTTNKSGRIYHTTKEENPRVSVFQPSGCDVGHVEDTKHALPLEVTYMYLSHVDLSRTKYLFLSQPYLYLLYKSGYRFIRKHNILYSIILVL